MSLYTLFSCCFFFFLALTAKATHPDPESIVQDLHSKVNESVWRRRQMSDQNPCQTGNPVDDCWRCDPNWQTTNRQKLADCGVGFGQHAHGGKGGQMYLVTDPSDNNPQNPTPGTLRYATVQSQPLWIVFSASMIIKLNLGLTVNSFKTIDGRGVDVHITGAGCILILDANNVIIHNLHIHNCVPSLDSDGDGISILGSKNIWVDHCSLSYCADGLVDVTLGSTGVTISNSYFSHHDKVMLLGHNDEYEADRGMQVTVAFNLFGEALTERMPRCRWGYFHVVNNDYRQWGAYAVGGSASPTINSQGNRYIAPSTNYAKEVTARINSDKQEWSRWNWRTEGDIMLNGAFFVPSGYGGLAASVVPKPAALIDQLTMNAGVFGNKNKYPKSRPSPGDDGGGSGDYPGIIYGSEAPVRRSIFLIHLIITCIWIIHIIL